MTNNRKIHPEDLNELFRGLAKICADVEQIDFNQYGWASLIQHLIHQETNENVRNWFQSLFDEITGSFHVNVSKD